VYEPFTQRRDFELNTLLVSKLLTAGSKEGKDFSRWHDLTKKLFSLEQLFKDIEALSIADGQQLLDPEVEDESSSEDDEVDDDA